jgi:hypothetical protein
VLTLTFKAIHGLSPTYITDLIKVKEQSRYNLSSNKELLLAAPSLRLHPTLGDRSFSSAAPREWNALPAYIHVRNITQYDSFKKHLKTFLFHKAYDI